MKQIRLAVFFGGCSTEHDISLRSASSVLAHLDPRRYEIIPVGITKTGEWRYVSPARLPLRAGQWEKEGVPVRFQWGGGQTGLRILDEPGGFLPIDIAFPVMHGKNGEDGSIQGLFQMASLPYVGCRPLCSALCMDKDISHRLVSAAGIRVPSSILLHRESNLETAARSAEGFGYPLYVKPANSGSSIGITKAHNRAQLFKGIAEAFRHDGKVILEENIEGAEIGCAIMGKETLFLGEIDRVNLSSDFFDYTDKYVDTQSTVDCPAPFSPEQAEAIRQAARIIYRALQCSGLARVDLFLTPLGQIIFNEVNTMPGFTANSRYPRMMRAAGLEFSELLNRLIDLAEV